MEGLARGAVYVHVPFCRRRCRYCDFAVAIREPDAAFVDDVAAELRLRIEEGELCDGFVATSLFLGGGTPSCLDDRALARLLRVVALDEGAEVTIEVNPEDLDPVRARHWQALGVVRVSVGLQSMDDRVLGALGRAHRGRDALARIEAARAGAPTLRWSADLIFGSPQETDESWHATLEAVVGLGIGHVSTYALTIEPGSLLRSMVLDEEVLARRYEHADAVLSSAGYVCYEVSNWARPGEESRHNQVYWRHDPYVGLGPSAHSYVGSRRSWNVASWPRWRERVRAGLVPREGLEVLDEKQLALERIYLGLRQRDGVELDRVPSWLEPFVEPAGTTRVRLSLRGRLVADAIAARLAAEELERFGAGS